MSERDQIQTPALRTAWDRGCRARGRGEPKESCPYEDHRTSRGGVTFSRAFIRAWEQGWEHKDKKMKVEQR